MAGETAIILGAPWDAAPDATLIIDELGSIWFANRRFSALFGYAHDEIIGKSIEKLMPVRFDAQYTEGREHQLFARRRDGTLFPVEVSLTRVDMAGPSLIAAAIRDVA
jgi:PAS domain S-box-containing protein